MDLDAILTAVAAKLATVAGMAQTSAYHPDSISDTPFGTCGMPRGRLVSGSWELGEFTLPVRVYWAKVSDDPTTAAGLLPFVAAVIAAFRSGITLGGLVTEIHIDTWDANVYATVAGETYQAIDFSLVVTLYSSQSYSA